ncbi:MAG: type 1 glutamine amidotransferase [Lentimonas sp.]|jgi:type 1 glutamine amidotransferase
MNLHLSLSCLLLAGSLSATPTWVPHFDDKPVPAERMSAIEAALPQDFIVAPESARRVLVFSATAGFRHQSIPTGKVALEQMGVSSGAYTATVSDDPANFELPVLKGFDAVILLSPSQDFFMPNANKQRDQFTDEEWAALQVRHNRLVDNLLEYVNQGGGLVGIHAASDACYGHQAYGAAIGGYFAGHPWTADCNVTIVVEDGEHAIIKPVFEGMKDFRIQEEIYQFRAEPYSRESLRVLLHLDPERSDVPKSTPNRADNDYAVCWVQSVGKGRVFYTSLGHNHHIYTNPLLLKHYLAGIQFATGDLAADTTPSSQ